MLEIDLEQLGRLTRRREAVGKSTGRFSPSEVDRLDRKFVTPSLGSILLTIER